MIKTLILLGFSLIWSHLKKGKTFLLPSPSCTIPFYSAASLESFQKY
ncbi:hypothetical protein B488_05560 [Liberibacter crescens BT-1]|uniref:Uncharacterized protein n=1 Tax=Liberibacter crescens (strain BT-1) TaxID=1215343 RepID=L0EV83_LIBCB|nr:hypothetical protein B488_05560 [Liberibacter crescens BT-1]